MAVKRSKSSEERRLINEQYDRRIKALKIENIKVKVPKSISGTFLISLNIDPELDSKTWKEATWIVLDAIIEQEFRDEYKKNNTFSKKRRGYVPLMHLYLREKISQRYTKRVLDALVGADVIETDGSWQDGVKSKGYRIADKYWNRGIKFRTITNPYFLIRHKRIQLKKLEESRKRLHEHAHLTKWLLNNNLVIHKTAAVDYLHELYSMTKFLIKDQQLNPDVEKEALAMLNNTIKEGYERIMFWEQSSVADVSVDKAGFRMHTPLTRLLSPLRNFLVYQDVAQPKQLVYFDISNSQPFHILAIINEKFWQTSGQITLHKLNKELMTYLKKKEGVKLKHTIMMIKQRFKNSVAIGNKGLLPRKGARTLYGNLVVNGKLYKFISDELKGKFFTRAKTDKFGNKEAAKNSMMKLLYFNDKDPLSSQPKPFKEFCKLFPELGAVITILKSRDYVDFSILLQRIESQILLRIVAKNIFKINSDIPLYSIHDGLVTTKDYVGIVEREINIAYKEVIGIEPNLKCHELSPVLAKRDLMNEAYKRMNKVLIKLD